MVLVAAPASLYSQQALTSAVEGDRAYRSRSSPQTPPYDRLKAGPVTFDVGLAYALDWNDNIRYASSSLEDDFIHRPQLNLRAVWPAKEHSSLSFGVGIGYLKYMKNSDLDRFVVTPDSELAWDIRVKDCVFTLYDRFQYSQDVLSQGALSGTAEFPRIENTAGARGRWYLERYLFELGYGHYNFFAESSDYAYLNRSSELLFGRAAYRFAQATHAGVETSSSLTSYDPASRSDNTSVSVGPFVEWQITRAIRLSLRGGYVFYFFDPSQLDPQGHDLSSWYAGIEANHQLTKYVTHGLTASREASQGINLNSEFMELLSVRYFLSWAFYRHARFTGDFLYEHGSEPQTEEYDRFGFGAGLNYQLLRRLSAGVLYRLYNKDSDFNSFDYRQNGVTLSVGYQF